jgi:hypothetical protein
MIQDVKSHIRLVGDAMRIGFRLLAISAHCKQPRQILKSLVLGQAGQIPILSVGSGKEAQFIWRRIVVKDGFHRLPLP